jgi:hypothetical protein
MVCLSLSQLFSYCDGNSFSGFLSNPVVVNGDNIYFRGHNVLVATLMELANLHNLRQASSVLLSGCSAGGLSTYLHADFVGEMVQSLAPRLSKYGAAPVSGFFLLHNTVENIAVYPSQIQNIFVLSNASYGLNKRCIANAPSGLEWYAIL